MLLLCLTFVFLVIFVRVFHLAQLFLLLAFGKYMCILGEVNLIIMVALSNKYIIVKTWILNNLALVLLCSSYITDIYIYIYIYMYIYIYDMYLMHVEISKILSGLHDPLSIGPLWNHRDKIKFPLLWLEDRRETQHDLTSRIYVLHKITTALKFMSYINQKLWPSYQTALNLHILKISGRSALERVGQLTTGRDHWYWKRD